MIENFKKSMKKIKSLDFKENCLYLQPVKESISLK